MPGRLEPIAPPAPGRWAMWAIPSFLFLIAFGHRVAPGVIAKELMEAFSASGTLVGLLSAAYFYPYAGLMVPAGLLVDAFGVRRVVAAGGAIMGLGTVLMGLTPGQGLLFVGRLAVGAGASVTFVGALKIAATWFPPSHFATLSAVTATMGVLGGLAATAPLAALVSIAGWRGALVLVGAVTVAGAVLCHAMVRDRPGEGAATGPAAASLREVLAGTRQVLRNRRTWPPFLAFFFLYAAASNLMLWVVPYMRDVYRLGTTDAALYATAISLALLVAGPLTGYLSDRVLRRRKLPYTVLTASQALLYLLLVLTLGHLPLAAVYALFFAIGAAGGAFVLTWPIGREVNPPRLSGVAVAVVNMGGFLGAALTQGPVGAVLDARWAGVAVAGARVYPPDAYRAAFLVCAAFVLASMVTTFFLRETRGRNVADEVG
jgi:MFS family permease